MYDNYKETQVKEGQPKIQMLEPPKTLWSMKIGSMVINHVKPINFWQIFWLRFAGWEVTVMKEDAHEQ